eukprot:m.112121 g.112121  ORF g.112121 m.112121 type:complete len:88 (+) comp28170_c0_seq1:260-523(+)
MLEWLDAYMPSTHMDFKGQETAEKLFQYIILSFCVVGFIWGYVCEQFSQTIHVMLAGVVTASILCLPPWPFFRQNPVEWLQHESSRD